MDTLMAWLVAATGISAATANTVFNLVNAGATMATVITLIVTSGGILAIGGAVLWLYIKKKAKDLGRQAFISW